MPVKTANPKDRRRATGWRKISKGRGGGVARERDRQFFYWLQADSWKNRKEFEVKKVEPRKQTGFYFRARALEMAHRFGHPNRPYNAAALP